MSWFSELAGKAEALLDRMDQAAASSLQVNGWYMPHDVHSGVSFPGMLSFLSFLFASQNTSLGSTPQRKTPSPGPQKLEPPRLSYEPTAHPLPPPSSSVAGSDSTGPGGTSSVGSQLLSKPRALTKSATATEQSKGHPVRYLNPYYCPHVAISFSMLEQKVILCAVHVQPFDKTTHTTSCAYDARHMIKSSRLPLYIFSKAWRLGMRL